MMINQIGLFRKLAENTDSVNFYLNHTTFGFFFFERKKCKTAYFDKRLSHFLNFDNEENFFSPSQYLDNQSKSQLIELSKLTGQEINDQESFFPLVWQVDTSTYQTTCNAYWLQSDDIVLVGLTDIQKLKEGPREKDVNDKTAYKQANQTVEQQSIININEKKSQEEQLRLFESVIKHTKDAVSIAEAGSFDLASLKIVFVNRAFCEMTGYTSEELIGQTPSILHGAKTDRKILDKIRASLEKREHCEYELIGYKKSGEEYWVNMSITPLTNEKGEWTHWIATERGITKQREHEAKLKEAREDALRTSTKLSNLFNAMEDIVFELDYNGTYVNVAPTKNKDRFGIKPSEELAGKTLHDVFPKEEADHFLSFVRQCLDSNKPDIITYPLQLADQTIWFEGRGTPMGRDRLLYIATEITDRKHTEQELIKSEARLLKAKEKAEESEQRLKLAVESAQIGIWDWNLNDNEFNWDDKTHELLGYNKNVNANNLQLWYDNLHPDDKDRAINELEEALLHKKEYSTTYKIVQPSGKQLYLNIYGRSIRSEDGEVIRMIGVVRDVTEEKNKEIELLKSEKEKSEESEQRLQLATNSAQLGIWEWNIGENSFIWDNKTCELLGHDKGRTEITLDIWFNSIHKDDRGRAMNEINDALDGKKEYNTVYRVTTATNKTLHVHVIANVIRDEKGKAIRMVGVIRDRTAQKVSEENLTKQSRIRLFLIELASEFINIPLAKVPDAIDKALAKIGNFFNVDRTYVIEYDLQRMTARNTFEWCAEGISSEIENMQDIPIASIKNLVEEHKEGKKWIIPDTSVMVDGEFKEILLAQSIKSLITLPLMLGSECIGCVGFDSVKNIKVYSEIEEDLLLIFSKMLVNISAREISEQELVRSESNLIKAKEKAEQTSLELNEAQKLAKLGSWHLDIFTNKVTWSEELFKVYGYELGSPVPDYPEFEKIHTPGSWARLDQAIRKTTATGMPYEIELEFFRKDESKGWMWARGESIFNEEKKVIGIRGVSQDITERKKLELELTHSKEKAEAASVAKSEFLAIMSHEIRTPLNSVIGFSDLLLQTELNNLQEDYIQSVNYSANTLLDLINDILDFSKIEAGKLELELASINLHKLLYQVVEMIKFKVKEKEIELLLHIASEVPNFVVTDAVRIKQVLVNLMDNAAKFTESGEIELSVLNLAQPKEAESVLLRFGVRDTGIGISKAQQEKIFEAFSQEDTSITRKYGGTGLGLSISKQLLSLMGSALQLKSEQGKGSFFFFDINLKNEVEPPIKENYFEGINNILLIDNNARNLEIIESLFDNSNANVDTANNGLDGLAKLQTNWQLYDAIILDHKMQLLNGEEVIKKIKETLPSDAQQLPILIMFDFLDKQTCEKIKKSYSITGCLQKPITKKELLRGISLLKNKPEATCLVEVAASGQPSSINFDGQSLLVVDDNAMNRKLVDRMLKKLFEDAEVIGAENGEKALELVKKRDFAMILMDIQMPGISGYETTRRIREAAEENDKTIIIALTAATIKGEKERCLAAGMDDYMSKPVTISKLKTMAEKWMGKNEKWEEGTNNDELSDSDSLDFNYQTFLQAFGNDVKSTEVILDSIRKGDLTDRISELNKIFKDGGKEEIHSMAHKIKGICLNLYFEKLAERLKQLETLYPHYDTKKASLLLQQINECHQTVIQIISAKEYYKISTSNTG